jgi:hypothetical protein
LKRARKSIINQKNAKTPKLKRCKACENIFIPTDPCQQVCGYNCAEKTQQQFKSKKTAAD